MERREALKHVAFLMGGTIITSSGFLSACKEKKQEEIPGEGHFTEKDLGFITEVGETILPATDTPGAKEAGVAGFVATMVVDCYDPATLDTFKNGIATMTRSFEQEFGHSYEQGDLEERTIFLNRLEDEAEAHYLTKSVTDPEHYYRIFKELVLLGYFTSEPGCTKALEYVAVPGRYEGCIPYNTVNKAWAPNV